MLERRTRHPRATGDDRMYLYYESRNGKLLWYVRVERAGRKLFINDQPYGTPEFDTAYKAAVAELGGQLRMRRTKPDEIPFDPRRYLVADRATTGQLRWYVQLRNKLPKIRIRAEHGSEEFDRLVEVALDEQIGLYGDGTQEANVEKPRGRMITMPVIAPVRGTVRWYWHHYTHSDHWLGNPNIGLKGLKDCTRNARMGLVEPLLAKHGEVRFELFEQADLIEVLNATTVIQAGNLLSALRGMIRWMIDKKLIQPNQDPTLGLKSGKSLSKSDDPSDGFVPWTEEDMALYSARWEYGTEARLMYEILRCTFLRRGDAHRFGPPHLTKGRMQITLEKGGFKKTVDMKVHPDLIKAINAMEGRIGFEVFTGKLVKGRIELMSKESWAAKFKKYAILAGVNEAKKSCHGVRKARAEDAAYRGMSDQIMMRAFGWDDVKMPSLYSKKANAARLADAGMDMMIEGDRNENIIMPGDQNRVVTFVGNSRGKR